MAGFERLGARSAAAKRLIRPVEVGGEESVNPLPGFDPQAGMPTEAPNATAPGDIETALGALDVVVDQLHLPPDPAREIRTRMNAIREIAASGPPSKAGGPGAQDGEGDALHDSDVDQGDGDQGFEAGDRRGLLQ